jgi:phosphopantothenoylcysteine decarboxylase/phosphopantothenate--cysteine ligase
MEFSASGKICHIELSEWADVFAIAPMTANTWQKIAHKISDNLLTSTVLACTKTVVMFPAMNSNMWENVGLQYEINNLRGYYLHLCDIEACQGKLKGWRYVAVQPDTGKIACGSEGEGKLPQTRVMVEVITNILEQR